MKLLEASPTALTVQLTSHEALIINNALNEACNGGQISDLRFSNRIGGARASVRALLSEINSAIDASPHANSVQANTNNVQADRLKDVRRIVANTGD